MPEQDISADISNVVAHLAAAAKNVALYSGDHPQVGLSVDKAFASLAGVLRTRSEVTIMLIGSDLVAENRPLPADIAYVESIVRVLRRKGVERATFAAGLSRAELQAFILDLASPESGAVRSSGSIKLGKVELRAHQAGGQQGRVGDGTPAGALEELAALTASELDELRELYLRIKRYKQIDVRSVDEMVKRFIKGFRDEADPLRLLASLKSSHEYTFTHVVNVGILTMAQAESLGFPGEHLHQIGVASFLHDIGKLFVPDEILNKKGKLSQDERAIIETHTVKGARYLMGTEGIPKLAVLASLEHHLKFDGSGYPSIKGGWTPNIASQMISISDVFDAMRSRRVYQEPQPLDRIESALRGGAGKEFNPKLVDNFLKLIRT